MGHNVSVSRVIGSKALIANETTGSELSTPAGEWMSDLFKPSTSDTSTACLIFDVKFARYAKRMNVELIYQDVNNTVQTVSLFDHDVGTKDLLAKEQCGTFEFHLKNVLQYQVCIFYYYYYYSVIA